MTLFNLILAFLFTIATILILAETTRSRIKESKRRDGVIDRIETLEETIHAQSMELERSRVVNEEGFMREKELEKIVEEVSSTHLP